MELVCHHPGSISPRGLNNRNRGRALTSLVVLDVEKWAGRELGSLLLKSSVDELTRLKSREPFFLL